MKLRPPGPYSRQSMIAQFTALQVTSEPIVHVYCCIYHINCY